MRFMLKQSVTAVLLMVCGLLFLRPAYADVDKVMTEGVVRKLDLENRKITIKHGEIKNLDMPGMTMVFRLPPDISLDMLKPGDKVLFHLEKIDGAYVITDVQAAP